MYWFNACRPCTNKVFGMLKFVVTEDRKKTKINKQEKTRLTIVSMNSLHKFKVVMTFD